MPDTGHDQRTRTHTAPDQSASPLPQADSTNLEIATFEPSWTAEYRHVRQIVALVLPRNEHELKVARCADELEAMLEFIDRLAPLLALFDKYKKPELPAGVKHIANRLVSLGEGADDVLNQFNLARQPRPLADVAKLIKDIFDKESEYDNRRRQFELCREQIRKTLDGLHYYLEHKIGTKVTG